MALYEFSTQFALFYPLKTSLFFMKTLKSSKDIVDDKNDADRDCGQTKKSIGDLMNLQYVEIMSRLAPLCASGSQNDLCDDFELLLMWLYCNRTITLMEKRIRKFSFILRHQKFLANVYVSYSQF